MTAMLEDNKGSRNRNLTVGFLVTVSGRWPKDLPAQRRREFGAFLEGLPDIEVVDADALIVERQDARDAIAKFKANRIDLVFNVMGAFCWDAVPVAFAEALAVPYVLWAPPEPPFDGARIIANALVAATMNAAALRRINRPYAFVYGDLHDECTRDRVKRLLRVHGAVKKLKTTLLALIGYRPVGFYSSTFDEMGLRTKFGIEMEHLDLTQVVNRAEAMDGGAVEADMACLRCTVRVGDIPSRHMRNHSKLYLALREIVREQGFDGVALKCWPEMGMLRYTPCAAVSRLIDDGVMTGCEADVDGTVTMLMVHYLTGTQPFFADLITIDTSKNTATFWHCGSAARGLKNPDDPVLLEDHSLAGRGAVFEFTLKPGVVTIARLTQIDGEYVLFLARGEALATVKKVKGSPIDVRFDIPVTDLIQKIADEGIPHHYTLVWEDITEELRMLCKSLDMRLIEV